MTSEPFRRVISIGDWELPQRRTRSQSKPADSRPSTPHSDNHAVNSDGRMHPTGDSNATTCLVQSPPHVPAESKPTGSRPASKAAKRPSKESAPLAPISSGCKKPEKKKKQAPAFTLDPAEKFIKARQDAFRRDEARYARTQESKDHLLRSARPGHTYVDKQGKTTFDDGRFSPKRPTLRDHPKLREAAKAGTLTPEMELWYRDMKRDVNISRAGIPSDKAYTPHYPHQGPPDDEDVFHARPSIKLIIPDILKALLVDDWENITKNNQLVPLPHPHPVSDILSDYSEYEATRRPAGSSHVDILDETLQGLKEYFNKSLGRILLYRFERAQYAEVYKKWQQPEDPQFRGKSACETYGPEHLMRLLVSLPELIAQTNMDQQSVNRLREELVKFCSWLSKHTTEYFVSHYESPPQDYIQKAKD